MRQIEPRDTDSLIPYANNARTHSAEQVAQVAASIKEFGFTNPVLIDEQGGVIAAFGSSFALSRRLRISLCILRPMRPNWMLKPLIALQGGGQKQTSTDVTRPCLCI